jgi:hypothetical protein
LFAGFLAQLADLSLAHAGEVDRAVNELPTQSAATTLRIVRGVTLRPTTTATDTEGHRALRPPDPSYGLETLTGGRARAIALNLPLPGFPQLPWSPEVATMETAWHYHNCTLQLAFRIGGAHHIAFCDNEWRLHSGYEILAIPGYVPHNAGRGVEPGGVIELTFPGDFGVTPCAAPPSGTPEAALILTDAMVEPKTVEGVGNYALPAHIGQIVHMRLVEAGAAAVDPPAGDGLTLTLIITGTCEVETGSEGDRLTPFDMLVDDGVGRGRARLLNRSPDFRAYQVQVQ